MGRDGGNEGGPVRKHETCRVRVAASVLGLVWALAATAAQTDFVVRDHLNRSWNHELLTYTFEAPKGECAAGSVRLAGPAGPVAVQLSDVELWPDTPHVKSARVSFIVDELPALASRTYGLTYGAEPARGATVQADLSVAERKGLVEVTTGRFGARLLQGGKAFDAPVAATEVPGPVVGMRLADGTWFGGSRLYGEAKVASWSSEVTARGPIFAEVESRYTYADGSVLTVSVRLAAGDYAIVVDMNVTGDRRQEDGWELVLGKGARFDQAVLVRHQRSYTDTVTRPLDPNVAEPVAHLCSWPGDKWFPGNPSSICLLREGGEEQLQVCALDPGLWVEPRTEAPWFNFLNWSYEMIGVMWEGWNIKRMPLVAVEDGAVLRASLVEGKRRWSVGADAGHENLLARYRGQYMSVYSPQPRLNRVKDMVLEWPDGEELHPYLILSDEDIVEAGPDDPEALADLRNLGTLRGDLDKLGTMDLMRHLSHVVARYDALIESEELTREERALFRAQMAYLGYLSADPFHWSFERGSCSGNPNMTVSRVTNLGMLGCALRDHPMGETWARQAVDWMTYWLENCVNDAGSFPESSHYARVSWCGFVQFALCARKARYHDFFKEPKFRAMGMFYEKTLTPPDPLRHAREPNMAGYREQGIRVDAPHGRGTRGDAWGVSGLIARGMAESDPEYSRVMQWSWRESGHVFQFSHSLSGLSALYTDRSLPASAPDWRSEYLPGLGYVLRSDVGTPQEDYLLFVSHYYRSPDGEIWPSHTGMIGKWFANGVPMAGAFSRAPETSHVLMENRVLLACNWDPAAGNSPPSGYFTVASQDAFAALPQADYVSVGFDIPEIKQHHLKVPRDAPAFPKMGKVGSPPLRWQRQVLLARGDEAGEPDYLVLRDTVRGGQPTQWHFWSLSEKLGSPAEAAQREAFLADKPGAAAAPLRALEGDRFTALGQFGSDLDYYVASPRGTPRYTLRYGTASGAYAVRGRVAEYQDLLHLQMPGDGEYFVVAFARPSAAAAPQFVTLGDGRIIKLSGGFGTDYCFLSREPAEATGEAAAFSGTAGSVRDRTAGLTLVLPASGTIRYKAYGMSAPVAASLAVSADALDVVLSPGSAGGTVTCRAPGKWQLASARPGVKSAAKGGAYELEVPAGVTQVRLVRAP